MTPGSQRPLAPSSQPLSTERWTTLEPLIDRVLELPPGERQYFLDGACAGDKALRGQMDLLLKALEREDSLLGLPAAAQFASLLDEEPVKLPAVLGDRYRLDGKVGRGGMATVYSAHDIRHDRQVAVKVLHPELTVAVGATRFLAEIRTTAQLQHPHILPLYDSGDAAGVLYYVTPYVDGGSLRDRLDAEPQLPIEDAVRIACEVASALHAAHLQNVIHRDIKPENILLQDGTALLSDFGIALALSAVAGPRITGPGLCVGTPQYMSPEQATGDRPIDSRSDIYSLAAVTYEMLTGEPPFSGATTTATIAKLLALPAPSPRVVRSSISAAIDAAVTRALAREPADRYRTAGEFAAALQAGAAAALPQFNSAPSRESALQPGPGWRTRPPRAKQLAAALAFLSLMGAGVGTWSWRARHRLETRAAVRFPLSFAGDVTVISAVLGSTVTISPDGRTVVFVGLSTEGVQQLYARPLDDLGARPLPGTLGAILPFFSADGKWLGFWADGKLQKVALDGSSVIPLADLPIVFGATWGPNHVIVAADGKGLTTISADGGAPHSITKPDSVNGEMEQRWPLALADGNTVLYTSWSRGGINMTRIGVASLRTGQSTILDLPGTFPMGVVDGLLVYASASGALRAVPFDARRGRVTGVPSTVVTDLVVGKMGPAKAGMSRDGSLVYQAGSSLSQLVIVDTQGMVRPLLAELKLYHSPRFSPDGKRISMGVRSPDGFGTDVWIFDVASRTCAQLTTGGNSGSPEWTPDGMRLIFSSTRGGGRAALWWQSADLRGPASLLLKLDNANLLSGVLSRDGQSLVYETDTHAIWHRVISGDTTSALIAPPSISAAMPRLSPDGRWLAYVLHESGPEQVVVRPFPGPGVRTQVSTDGGTEPVWSRDGHWLFYRQNQRVMAASIRTVPTFKVTSIEKRFQVSFFAGSYPGTHYDVSPDNMQLVFAPTAHAPRTIIVHNWRDELLARVAAGAVK